MTSGVRKLESKSNIITWKPLSCWKIIMGVEIDSAVRSAASGLKQHGKIICFHPI